MNRDNFEKILEGFKEKKIAVIGDVMLDIFIEGVCERVNPEEPGVPLLKEINRIEKIGGAGNVASNIVSLGGKCYLFGVVGNDYHGEVLEKLVNNGVEKGILLRNNRKTIVKERVIATGEGKKNGIVRIDREEQVVYDIEQNLAYEIIRSLNKNINEIDGVILQDYNKGLLTDYLTKSIIKIANENEIPVFVDPKKRIISNVTIFKPNKKELFEFGGSKDIKGACKELYEKINSEYLVVTAAEDGMYIYDGRELKNIPTLAKEVVDVMGAGDTVIASLALAYVSGANIYEAVDIANHAAGVVVSKSGTAVVGINELKRSFLENTVTY